MSPMSRQPLRCCVTVRGRVAPHWSPWLEELRLSYRVSESGDDVTDLTGVVADQSALHGLLNRIWNLNLSVLAVETRRETGEEEPPDGPNLKG